MTVRELGEKCKQHKDCTKCEYLKECGELDRMLTDIIPEDVLGILEEEIILDSIR